MQDGKAFFYIPSQGLLAPFFTSIAFEDKSSQRF
jgi:hypothetical protein